VISSSHLVHIFRQEREFVLFSRTPDTKRDAGLSFERELYDFVKKRSSNYEVSINASRTLSGKFYGVWMKDGEVRDPRFWIPLSSPFAFVYRDKREYQRNSDFIRYFEKNYTMVSIPFDRSLVRALWILWPIFQKRRAMRTESGTYYSILLFIF